MRQNQNKRKNKKDMLFNEEEYAIERELEREQRRERAQNRNRNRSQEQEQEQAIYNNHQRPHGLIPSGIGFGSNTDANSKSSENTSLLFLGQTEGHIDHRHSFQTFNDQRISILVVAGKLKYLMLNNFLVLFVTFLAFPTLVCKIPSQYPFINQGSWMPIILITEYNVCDYLGRQFLARFALCLNHKSITLLAIARLLLYAIFVLLHQRFLVSDIVLHATMVVNALSNGYLTCLLYMWLPAKIAKHEKGIASSLMTVALTLGILGGSMVALAVAHFVLPDIDFDPKPFLKQF